MFVHPIPWHRGTTAALLVALTAAPVAAAAGDARPQVTLTGDNDFMAGHDHHYTNGVQLAVSADHLLPPRGAGTRRLTLSLGQRIYTPTDKARAQPDPEDRPYAGWLYAMAELSANRGGTIDSLQLSVGVVGPAALARQTQNSYHAVIGANRAQGWGEQLANEPALTVGLQRSWPAKLQGQLGRFSIDLTPRAGFTLGTVYTYAHAGAVLRFGQNLPGDFAATDISLGPPRDGYRPGGNGFGWYAWFGTDVRAVAWNTFLDGNLSGNGPSVERKPGGFDLQAGVALSWQRTRVGFSMVRRSKEFTTQPEADMFGQLTVSFSM